MRAQYEDACGPKRPGGLIRQQLDFVLRERNFNAVGLERGPDHHEQIGAHTVLAVVDPFHPELDEDIDP